MGRGGAWDDRYGPTSVLPRSDLRRGRVGLAVGKVAEGEQEYRVGVTVRDKRRLGTQTGHMDGGERGQQQTTHQVFPNMTGSKKKSGRARILLETPNTIAYIL